jgi:hypothetical protein
MKVVVPTGLEQTARLLTAPGATQYQPSPGCTVATQMVRVPDAMRTAMGVQSVQVVYWNKLTEANTVSQSTWYLAGNSKRQFVKHQRWATQFSRASAAQLGGDDFQRDVLMKFSAGFNAGFRAIDDKYVIQCAHS